MVPRGGFVYSFTRLAEDSEDSSSTGSSTPGPRTSGHGRADVPRTDVERPEHPAGDGATAGAEGRRGGMAPAWAEAGLEQLCCHIPWCRSGAAGLVCIYSRGSVHSTRQFLIYRLGGGGRRCPHPVTGTNVLLWGGATVPASYRGVLGKGFACLEV